MALTETKLPIIPDCDFCKVEKVSPIKKAVYDGKTNAGFWAYMCDQHFRDYGTGLGLGKGQKLIKEEVKK